MTYAEWYRYYKGRNFPTGCSLHLMALWVSLAEASPSEAQ